MTASKSVLYKSQNLKQNSSFANLGKFYFYLQQYFSSTGKQSVFKLLIIIVVVLIKQSDYLRCFYIGMSYFG